MTDSDPYEKLYERQNKQLIKENQRLFEMNSVYNSALHEIEGLIGMWERGEDTSAVSIIADVKAELARCWEVHKA